VAEMVSKMAKNGIALGAAIQSLTNALPPGRRVQRPGRFRFTGLLQFGG